jgi:hypothetical protein
MILLMTPTGQVSSCDLDPKLLALLFGGKMTVAELKESIDSFQETLEWIERVSVDGPPPELSWDEAKGMTLSEYMGLCKDWRRDAA